MAIEEYIVASDQQLVAQAIDGDQTAFEHLFTRYREAILQLYIQRTHGDTDGADDLLQETFVKVFINLVRYDPAYTFGQWIFTIARNTFVDYARRKRDDLSIEASCGDMLLVAPISLQPSPEESIISQQQRQLLDRCMARLAPSYRQLIELRFFREYSYEEIARELSMPLGTVKTRIHRARTKLCELMLADAEL
ncbi:MAG: sigma-70 family RNA polymerase sigma factor [Rikenellaceae bacterium]|jgi:RNA polymerase sigma-70 factor (ECF subfamily)|nr:sigma-70 family RNA polymerase sigma factor [Rikenellaceae bacterium]